MKPGIEKKTHTILYENPLWKGIIWMSIPVFLSNVLKTLHDLVDGFVLGQVPNVDGFSVSTSMQSAVSLTWPVYFIFLSFGVGLSVAGNALIGQYVGRDDLVNARKYAFNTILLSLILGIAFNIFVYFTAPVILGWMGATGSDLDYAITYLQIRSFELPILFLSFAFQAIRQATGDTVTPVIVNAISIVINIILTPIMILVLKMGIVGAAVSTLIAHWLMLPLIIIFFSRIKSGIKIDLKNPEPRVDIMKDLINIALPASSGQAIQALGFVILNSFIYSFGTATSAAFFIGNRINSLVMFPVSSISAIVAIYIAQNVGAGNIPRARKSFRTGMFLAVILMTFGALLIIPFRTFLVGMFNHDQETVRLAAEYTLFLHIGLPFMGVFQTYLSTFQGSGETKFSFLLAITRLWAFRIPLVLIFMNFTDLGPSGVWYAMLISNLLAVFVGMFLYSKVRFLPKIRMEKAMESPAEAT